MKYLVFLFLFVSCQQPKKERAIITLDLKNRIWLFDYEDSLWTSERYFIPDGIDTLESGLKLTYGHSKYYDTVIRLKNLKPFVIITDNDTNRYWISGDTLRFTTCGFNIAGKK